MPVKCSLAMPSIVPGLVGIACVGQLVVEVGIDGVVAIGDEPVVERVEGGAVELGGVQDSVTSHKPGHRRIRLPR